MAENPIPHSSDEAKIVRDGYDTMAAKYLEFALSRPYDRERYTDSLLKHLPNASKAKVLEIGCGAGLPVTKRLADSVGEVVSNDISSEQIRLAREHLQGYQNVHFICDDMRNLKFQPGAFDGLASFFALFHIPRSEQSAFFHQMHGWMKPGGVLVCSLATRDGESIQNKFLGANMFWSSWSTEGNLEMLKTNGFEIVESEVLEATDLKDPSGPDAGVSFLWVVARKAGREKVL